MTAHALDGGAAVLLPTSAGPVAALQRGDPDDRPVLLVPGYTGSKEDFVPVLAALAAAGTFVTAIDLPGQYESPGPADPAAYTPDRLAASVCAVAKSVGSGRAVHLVGHSFGGLVARAAVLASPPSFASLVLMGSGPAGIGGARRALIERLEPMLLGSGLPAVYAASQQLAAQQPGFVPPPPPLAAFLERRFLAGSPSMLHGMGLALRHEPDRIAELAAIDLPLLVLHGADDDAWPAAVQQEMAERLDASYVVVPSAAHSPAVENPSSTTDELVRFWTH